MGNNCCDCIREKLNSTVGDVQPPIPDTDVIVEGAVAVGAATVALAATPFSYMFANTIEVRDDHGFWIIGKNLIGKDIRVTSLYICPQSDRIERYTDYAGIVLYASNGQNKWTSKNGIACETGMVFIKKVETIENAGSKIGSQVHGNAYKYLFGTELNDDKILGFGFSFKGNEFKFNSYTLNAENKKSSDQINAFKDDKKEAHEVERKCILLTYIQWIENNDPNWKFSRELVENTSYDQLLEKAQNAPKTSNTSVNVTIPSTEVLAEAE